MPTDNNAKELTLVSQVRGRAPRRTERLVVLAFGLSALSVIAVAGLFFYQCTMDQDRGGRSVPASTSYSLHLPIHITAPTAEVPTIVPPPEPSAQEADKAGDTLSQYCSESPTPRAVETFTKGEVDDLALHTLHGAVASLTESKVLATWSNDSVYLSVDDGKRFGSILSPPGELVEVVLSCGQVYALAKPNWIGHRDVDGNESWRPLSFLKKLEEGFPADKSVRIIADKGQLFVTQVQQGDALVASSLDHGISWHFQRRGRASAEYLQDVAVLDGEILVVLGLADCDWNGLELLSGTMKGGLSGGGEVSIYGYFGVGPKGSVFYNNYECQDTVCVASAKNDAKLRPVRDLPLGQEYSPLIRNHKAAFLVADEVVYRIGKIRAKKLSERPLSSDLTIRAADRRGRILAIDQKGALHRWNHKVGAQTLLAPSIRQ